MNKDNGTDSNNDDGTDKELNFDRMRKCKQCRRYTYRHTPPYGPDCTMEKKQDEEIERENRETLEKRRRMNEKRVKEDSNGPETLEENIINNDENLFTDYDSSFNEFEAVIHVPVITVYMGI